MFDNSYTYTSQIVNSTYSENQIINKIYLEKVSEQFKRLYKPMLETIFLKKTLPSTNEQGEINVPGFPGTMQNLMVVVLAFFENFIKGIDQIGVNLSSMTQSSFELIERDYKDSVFPDLEKLKISNEDINCEITRMRKIKPDSNSVKLNKKISKMLKQTSFKQKDIDDLKNLFQDVVSRRDLTFTDYHDSCVSIQAKIDNFLELLDNISLKISERNAKIVQIFGFLSSAFTQIISPIIYESITTINNEKKNYNFSDDLKRFTESRSIVRYDFKCPEFEVAPFEYDQQPIIQNPKPDFPVLLAEVVENFYAQEPNEMSCTIGKRLLCMEVPKLNSWCCVMNPVTKVIGYAPSYCLKPISKILGIFLLPYYERDSISLQFGDFLAVEDMNVEHNSYIVSSYQVSHVKLTKEMVGIISHKHDVFY